jgi:hypothetical protein
MSLDSRLPGARDDDVSKSHGASSVWPFGYVHKDNRHERARTIPLEIIQDREALGTGERKAKVSVQASGRNSEGDKAGSDRVRGQKSKRVAEAK